jgi:HK97 family phage portal protein
VKSLIGSFANKTTVPYVGRGWPFRQSGSSSVRQLESMQANATVFGIVNRTSTAVAKETWHLHRKVSNKSARCDVPGCETLGVTLVERHPALSVLGKPNDFYTTQEYFESGQQHVDLTGEGWTAVYRMGNVPYELWNLRPDRVVVCTSREKFLTGYLYVGPDGDEIPIRKEDMLSVRMPNPMDPYRGLGPVQAVLPNINSSKYSSEWNANFFSNGARPGGIIKLSRNLQDDEFDQLVERYNANHRGVANAGRTAFLEEGDWVDVKQPSVRDMQFVETANLNRDTVLLAFTGSKFDVGILEDVNRASATAAKASFAERLTVPRLDRWKGMLNNDFLPLFPGYAYDLEFVYSNPVPADKDSEREDKRTAVSNYVALLAAGVDPQEAAELCGIPPMRVVERAAPERTEPVNSYENAMRWVADEDLDEETCGPCRTNHGKTYRNRQEAYADYPGGKGFKDCEGRENCRGHVVKRGK